MVGRENDTPKDVHLKSPEPVNMVCYRERGIKVVVRIEVAYHLTLK